MEESKKTESCSYKGISMCDERIGGFYGFRIISDCFHKAAAKNFALGTLWLSIETFSISSYPLKCI